MKCYLKGVLTRSETYTEARLIERNWMQNQIRHLVAPSTLRVHRMVETAAFYIESTGQFDEVAYILTPFDFHFTSIYSPFTKYLYLLYDI